MRKALIFALLLTLWAQAYADERFNRWDKNKDKKLSKEELPKGLQRNFERVDTDKNGWISLEEHKAVLNRRRPADGARGLKGYKITQNIPYAGTENPKQMLDIALPETESEKPRPVMAFIHGGGWRKGDKAGGLNRIAAYLTGDMVGVSIGYRLTNEAQWPAQIHDCKAAIRWIKANAKKYNIDPNKIIVHGTSAGGHLVAMLGVSGGELEGKLGEHTDQNGKVAAVVDFFGPTELLTMNKQGSKMDHDAEGSPESLLIGGPIQKNTEKANHASPITYVTKDDAPILIAHGDKDPLVPYQQSVEFDALLDKAGVPSYLIKMENGAHGFSSPELTSRIKAFIDKYIGGKKDIQISEEAIVLKPR